MLIPVTGKIIRGYEKDKNDGIDIAAQAGAGVRVAADGVVAKITSSTDEVPILIVRHPNNLLTVYANIDNIKVKEQEKITRGQAIATVRGTGNSFLHFEVRDGFDSVDPVPFLN
jgi:murein DD-endopeptidase MepM/ murein hydrolase activator NlpD